MEGWLNDYERLQAARNDQLNVHFQCLLPVHELYTTEELQFSENRGYNQNEEFVRVFSGKFNGYFMKAELPPDTHDFYSSNGIGEREMYQLVARREKHLNRIDDTHSLLIMEHSHPFILQPICFFGSSKKLIDVQGVLYEDVKSSLKDHMEEVGGPDDETAIRWTLQLADALHYCHNTLQIMIRAINPIHVFVFLNGNNNFSLKLGGLLFAKKLGNTVHTSTPNPMIHFCAPETLGDGNVARYNFFSDIWSLGCLIYYFTHNGQTPYDPERRSAAMKNKIITTAPKPIRDSVHPVLKPVIEACLRKDYPNDGVVLVPRPTAALIIEHFRTHGFSFTEFKINPLKNLKSVSQSASQPVNQSVSNPVSQSVSQSVSQLDSHLSLMTAQLRDLKSNMQLLCLFRPEIPTIPYVFDSNGRTLSSISDNSLAHLPIHGRVTLTSFPCQSNIEQSFSNNRDDLSRCAFQLSQKHTHFLRHVGILQKSDIIRSCYCLISEQSVSTLESVFAPGSYPTLQLATRMARQFLTAIYFLHKKKLVHGLLEPKYVHFDSSHQVKLLLAPYHIFKIYIESTYTADELRDAHSKPTLESDIYSVGSIIYRMFHPSDPKLNKSDTVFRDDISPVIKGRILDCWKAPDQRPTAEAFIKELL